MNKRVGKKATVQTRKGKFKGLLLRMDDGTYQIEMALGDGAKAQASRAEQCRGS